MRDNKPKKIALITLVVAVIGLTVAFAALSNNLTISGNAKLDPINWDIYFDNISGVDLSGEAAVVNNPEIDSNDKTKITNFNVTLKKPGDKATFTVDLVNESDITAIISGIKLPTINYKFIEFSAYYTTKPTKKVSENDVIAAKTGSEPSRVNITISVYYSKEKVTNEDLEKKIPAGGLTIDLNYGLTFVQSDKTANMPTTTTKWINGCTEFTKKDTYAVGDAISFCNKNKGYTNSDGVYVKGKSEDFYVISDNGDTVSALASHNLMVGSRATDTYATAFPGLQAKSTTTYPVAFANKDSNDNNLGYWANNTSSKPLEAYGTSYPADVYDKNSILYDHVQKYQTYFIGTLNKTTAKMRLITYNELIGLGCEYTSYPGNCKTETVTTNKREWIYNTYYWTASARDYNRVRNVRASGYFYDNDFWDVNLLGARPVITISKSDI